MVTTALPSTRVTALEFLQEKPLPSPPSPTLTNPDLVLPDKVNPSAMPSPARDYGRPPSPSYLWDKTRDNSDARSATPKKEKRGLMSRKMLLLRSRTGSGMGSNGGRSSPHSGPPPASDSALEEYTYASSPVLQDVGNLAPEEPEQKRMSTSGSSFSSEDLAGIPSFLAKYDTAGATATDDDTDLESPAPEAGKKMLGYSVTIEGGMTAQRRQQEEDEHTSAMLSKRAEQILANAKKRLNLMEGNLRGARDLVAPLTTANLKRATSLNSSHQPQIASRARYVSNGYLDGPADQPVTRVLHAQASSPTMGRDYAGHARVFSELPERPSTALEISNSLARSGRIPVKVCEPSWNQSLKSSRSYDSLGSNAQHAAGRNRPLLYKTSPDPNLEPLPEDEGSQQERSVDEESVTGEQDDRPFPFRSPSRQTDDLREQMTSLNRKISNLKERAREDNLRRQSMLNLRSPSPFNNALVTAPEMFYTQSQSYGSPVLETNAGVGWTSSNVSPVKTQPSQKVWERNDSLPGSRNAFAQQAAAVHSVQQEQPSAVREATNEPQRQLVPSGSGPTGAQHKRTLSGTAIVAPAASRYSHHQQQPQSRSTRSLDSGSKPEHGPSGVLDDNDRGVSPLLPEEAQLSDDNINISDVDDESSVYEDAKYEQPQVVRHEDRDDAFDYEHFFLHSAMSSSNAARRGSTSSEDTVTSTETARAPVATQEDSHFDPESGIWPPPTPETPERLREIERNLHTRTLSSDTVSTLDTFATANEGGISPPEWSAQSGAMDWPIRPVTNAAHPNARANSAPSSRTGSRPSTAHKRPERRRDSSSERADSGVGLPRRSNSGQDAKRPGTLNLKSPNTIASSPPMSPQSAILHDPATVVVNALLDPHGKQLGLKDKAVLFSLVESLRQVCRTLQVDDEGQYESRVLRRRLDDARRALIGTLDQRPASHG